MLVITNNSFPFSSRAKMECSSFWSTALKTRSRSLPPSSRTPPSSSSASRTTKNSTLKEEARLNLRWEPNRVLLNTFQIHFHFFSLYILRLPPGKSDCTSSWPPPASPSTSWMSTTTPQSLTVTNTRSPSTKMRDPETSSSRFVNLPCKKKKWRVAFCFFISKVQASDSDSSDNSAIRYTRLLAGEGNESILKGLRLDPQTGEISVVNNNYLDREAMDSEFQFGSRIVISSLVCYSVLCRLGSFYTCRTHSDSWGRGSIWTIIREDRPGQHRLDHQGHQRQPAEVSQEKVSGIYEQRSHEAEERSPGRGEIIRL